MTNQIIDHLTVDGIVFEHGQNHNFEYYAYQGANFLWQTWRHRKGDIILQKTWYASEDMRLLNTAVLDDRGRPIHKDPLYDVLCQDVVIPLELLKALVELIKKDEQLC